MMMFFRSLFRVLPRAVLVPLISTSSLSAQTQISLGPSSGARDAELQVPILLGTEDQLGGVQIEFNFNAAQAEIGTPEIVVKGTRVRAAGNVVSPGKYRLLIFGEEGDVLPSGRIVNLPVTLKTTIPASTSAVTMTEVIISDEYGLQRNYQMAPYLELVPPNSGEPVDPDNPVPLSALADFGGGKVTNVDLFANGRLIGSVSDGSPTVNWTPEEPGSAVIRAVGTLPDGTSVEGSPVTVEVTGDQIVDYDSWKSYYFTAAQAANPFISSPLRDPDGDGRNNLREYAEGSKPTVSDAPPVDGTPFFVENGGDQFFAMRMRRRIQVPDVDVEATTSTDLENPVGAPVTDLEEAGNFEVVTFHTLSSIRESSKGFLQIVVSQPDAQ